MTMYDSKCIILYENHVIIVKHLHRNTTHLTHRPTNQKKIQNPPRNATKRREKKKNHDPPTTTHPPHSTPHDKKPNARNPHMPTHTILAAEVPPEAMLK